MFTVTTFSECLRDARRETRRALEVWSDAARLASAAARAKAGRASYRKDLDTIHKDKTAAAKAAAAARKPKGGGGDPTAAKRKEIAATFDVKIDAAAEGLRTLAAKGRGTPEYRAAYAQYQALQQQKRAALSAASGRKAAPDPPDPESKREKPPKTRKPGRMVFRRP